MVFTVSVRDIEKLEYDLNSGKKIKFPEECKRNSKVIYELFNHISSEKVPELSQLTEKEKRLMSNVVAYAMRPDLIKGSYSLLGPKPLNSDYPKKLISRKKVTLRNNPDDLKNREWKIPNEYLTIGSELFRCLSFARVSIPSVQSKFKHLPFDLADALAYLLNPEDLTDYLYTKEEIDKFHETLMKEATTV